MTCVNITAIVITWFVAVSLATRKNWLELTLKWEIYSHT